MAIADSSVRLPTDRPEGFWDGVTHAYIPGDVLRVDPSLALHTEVAGAVDPITHEVVRYALVNANLEHSALIQRLCISPIVMTSRDLQTSILTEDGELICLGPNLQYFSNSHALSIKFTLETRSGSPGIHPGDVFLCNDPFVGAPHQPDTALLAPVFCGDELFCWVANTMHHSDVGGSTPGSFCIDAADTFAEPTSWPPVKLVERGEVRVDIEQLFARQSRMPAALLMDLRAGIVGVEVTRAKIERLVARYGAAVVKAVMHGTLDAAEAVFVERLQSIPDGRWSHRSFTEAAVPGDPGIYAYQCAITKEGDHLYVDNVGTDPQAGAINITYAAFAGAVLAAITQQMTSDLGGAYGGVYRRVHFRPEPGLLNCADWPAAVSPSGALTTELQLNAAGIVVAKMLACGDDDARGRILGASIPHFYSNVCGGANDAGVMFIHPNTNAMMGSLGAMPDRDGVDTGGHFWIPDGIAANVEDIELQYPTVVLYRRMLRGGADGAGRHRGGLGFVEAAIPHRALVTQFPIYQNEAFTKALGLFGGNPGTRASFRCLAGSDVLARLAAGDVPQSLDGLAGDEHALGFKGAPLTVAADGVWEWVSPTTSGYGDPLRRDPALVAADVAAGVLDAERAERVHGVVVRDGIADGAATDELRLARRRERLDGADAGPLLDPPPGARRVGELLHVVDGRWWCNGADLGPAGETYKQAAPVRERSARAIAPEFEGGERVIADQMVFREWLCPITGYLIDTEIVRAGEDPVEDIVLHGGAPA